MKYYGIRFHHVGDPDWKWFNRGLYDTEKKAEQVALKLRKTNLYDKVLVAPIETKGE